MTVTWLAAADRVAHAHTRDSRTLCGLPRVLERMAWPVERRCIACDVLAKRR